MQAWAFKSLNHGSNREVTSRSRRQQPISFGFRVGAFQRTSCRAQKHTVHLWGVKLVRGQAAGKMRANEP
jgi:hypothetical protein